MGRFPKLPQHLKRLLQQIDPSHDLFMDYFPCLVTTRARATVDRVYVQHEVPYFRSWRIDPRKDHGKFSINIEDVVSLAESPCRLPAGFASQLYQEGETGMGGHEFSVTFSDGTTAFYIGGNAVDFIDYPPGKSKKDIVAVKSERRENARTRPRYFWCLYS